MERVQIGTYVVPKPTEFENTFEFAAWFQKVLVPAGEYPAYATLQDDQRINDSNGITAKLPGTVVSSDFSSYFGSMICHKQVNEDVGQPANAFARTYTHAVAHSILTGKHTSFRLNKDFEAALLPYHYHVHDGTTPDGKTVKGVVPVIRKISGRPVNAWTPQHREDIITRGDVGDSILHLGDAWYLLRKEGRNAWFLDHEQNRILQMDDHGLSLSEIPHHVYLCTTCGILHNRPCDVEASQEAKSA